MARRNAVFPALSQTKKRPALLSTESVQRVPSARTGLRAPAAKAKRVAVLPKTASRSNAASRWTRKKKKRLALKSEERAKTKTEAGALQAGRVRGRENARHLAKNAASKNEFPVVTSPHDTRGQHKFQSSNF